MKMLSDRFCMMSSRRRARLLFTKEPDLFGSTLSGWSEQWTTCLWLLVSFEGQQCSSKHWPSIRWVGELSFSLSWIRCLWCLQNCQSKGQRCGALDAHQEETSQSSKTIDQTGSCRLREHGAFSWIRSLSSNGWILSFLHHELLSLYGRSICREHGAWWQWQPLRIAQWDKAT